VVTRLGEVEDREQLCGLAARHHECARKPDGGHAAALEVVQPRLEHTLGRVHDARVDVADLRQREQVLRVRGVTELEARRLVDRHRSCAGGGVRGLTGVDLTGLETPLR
jgi:hypothetical protein